MIGFIVLAYCIQYIFESGRWHVCANTTEMNSQKSGTHCHWNDVKGRDVQTMTCKLDVTFKKKLISL